MAIMTSPTSLKHNTSTLVLRGEEGCGHHDVTHQSETQHVNISSTRRGRQVTLWETPSVTSHGQVTLWETPSVTSLGQVTLWETPSVTPLGQVTLWETPSVTPLGQVTLCVQTTHLPICALNSLLCSVQRSFSPPSPLMRAEAATILRRQRSASSISLCNRLHSVSIIYQPL